MGQKDKSTSHVSKLLVTTLVRPHPTSDQHSPITLLLINSFLTLFLGDGVNSVCTHVYGGLSTSNQSGTTGHQVHVAVPAVVYPCEEVARLPDLALSNSQLFGHSAEMGRGIMYTVSLSFILVLCPLRRQECAFLHSHVKQRYPLCRCKRGASLLQSSADSSGNLLVPANTKQGQITWLHLSDELLANHDFAETLSLLFWLSIQVKEFY